MHGVFPRSPCWRSEINQKLEEYGRGVPVAACITGANVHGFLP